MATIKIDVKPFIMQKTGCTPVDNYEHQAEWFSWYKNNNEWRCFNTMQNGVTTSRKRFSLNSIPRVCRDWASLIMNEPVVIACDNEDDKLQELLKRKNFMQLMNEAIEKSFALGGGALVWDKVGDDIVIQYVDATHCYPLDVKDGVITGCAFISQQIIGGKTYAFINIRRDNITQNFVLDEKGKEVSLSQFKLAARVDTGLRSFSFIKPRNLIRDDWNSPFAASVFADAIDANKMIDIAFDSLATEFKLGRKRIFISQDLIALKTQDGVVTRYFDPYEEAFNINPVAGADKQDIQAIDMSLRISEHEQGIQAGLNYFSSICGLGSNYYKYNNGSIATATQVISENSDLYRNIKKQQLNIDMAIKDFVKGAMALMGIDCGEVSIMHDDSIIIDRNAQMINDQQLVRDKLMSPIEFRMRNFGETKEMAIEMLGMIPEEINNFEDFNLNAYTEGNPESTADDNETI